MYDEPHPSKRAMVIDKALRNPSSFVYYIQKYSLPYKCNQVFGVYYIISEKGRNQNG
jgi:hypothetical protein